METSETAPRNAEELEEIADLIGELVASSSEMEHVISRLSRQVIRENLIRQARQSQAAYAGKSVEVWDRVLAILDLHLLAAHEDLQKLKRGIVRVKSILDQFQEIPAISLYRKIMDGIVVGVGNIRYVVPTEVVCRILHPEPGQIVFSTADGGKALNLRGELIPLYSLGDERNNNSSVLSDKMIIVVETARQLAALSVNKVIGRQQILICPLQGFMKEIKGAIGCCILGGGEIGVALDMNKMLAAA
jgi:chemotaxis protein histidine kinase CheA